MPLLPQEYLDRPADSSSPQPNGEPPLLKAVIDSCAAQAQYAAMGGLLHQFNNLITGISSLSSSCCESVKSDHPLQEDLQLILETSLRSQDLLRRIMEINCDHGEERRLFDIGSFVEEELKVLESILPNGSQLSVEIEEGALPVFADSKALRWFRF